MGFLNNEQAVKCRVIAEKLKIEADNLFRCCDDENETEAESLLVHMIEIDDMIEQIENVAEVLR